MAWKVKTDLRGVELTQELLKHHIDYNPDTGEFIRRAHPGVRYRRPKIVGTTHDLGYRFIPIKGEYFNAGRIAWLYMTGKWPEHDIDHINGDKADNRFCNLRDVTKTVNMHNYRKANANSASGRLGVSLHKQSGKWRARLRVARQIVFERLYKTVEEAEAAYLEAKRIHHADGCTI